MSHLLDHELIGQRYFFPRRAPLSDPWVVDVDGASLHCHRAAPHPGAPTLLHFHGNGEIVGDWRGDFVNALVAAGINVVLAEYRGYGASSGRPSLARMLDDAVAVADATGAPPSSLFVYGRSVGSIYALHVASQRPVGGLVIESGISDVLVRLLLRVEPSELGVTIDAMRDAAREIVDHRAKMTAYAGPVLVMHTRGDHIVPPSNAVDLAGWAGDRAELVLFERGDHNSIHAFNGAEILSRVTAFVRAAC
ncbi:MAG: alpha/beta hydrolase [Myxococcales bacterium]|nr:alpha/beta hydrolase [Myxococcales bacterium]